MNLNPIASNMTEIEVTHDTYKVKVLFSYKTPVAMKVLTECGMEYHVTDRFHSVTTSRHINKWMPKDNRIEHPQQYFDGLLERVK